MGYCVIDHPDKPNFFIILGDIKPAIASQWICFISKFYTCYVDNYLKIHSVFEVHNR